MQRIASGDRTSFAILLERYLPDIISFARRFVGITDADDIAQETFWRVWARAASWQADKGTARAWLYRIAYNLCMDSLRKRQPEAGPEVLDELAGSAGTPEKSLQDRQQEQQLQQAITQLPQRQQLALNLAIFQGLSNRDAADVMDVSIEALESLLSRARRQLKALLAEQQTGV